MANPVLERVPDVHQFERRARAFLLQREPENNLVLGLIAGLKDGRTFGPESPYFALVRNGATVLAAAMRTPPFDLLLTAGTDPGAVPVIVEDLLSAMPETPGLLGPKELAARAADLWSRRTGLVARLVMAQRIYQLTRVIPPRGSPGAARIAREDDRPTVVDWFDAFAREALPTGNASRENAEAAATHWMGSGALWVWDDGGPVAMAGASGRTPNGIRVSAVYTPADKRRRGYASSLVAALSQAQLDAGLRFCFLFTDLANQTSNKIYRVIGYEPVCDFDQYRFEGPAAADT